MVEGDNCTVSLKNEMMNDDLFVFSKTGIHWRKGRSRMGTIDAKSFAYKMLVARKYKAKFVYSKRGGKLKSIKIIHRQY